MTNEWIGYCFQYLDYLQSRLQSWPLLISMHDIPLENELKYIHQQQLNQQLLDDSEQLLKESLDHIPITNSTEPYRAL